MFLHEFNKFIFLKIGKRDCIFQNLSAFCGLMDLSDQFIKFLLGAFEVIKASGFKYNLQWLVHFMTFFLMPAP
jgi:hypothetical protein